jgi:hypothetical protein
MQKSLLPLYLESQNIVRRHQRVLRMIQESRREIPLQLIKAIDKGLNGLNTYSAMLADIHTSLVRNNYRADQLNKYQINMNSAAEKTQQVERNVASLGGG